MGMSLEEQLNYGISTITAGDIDAFAQMLTDPDTITPDELKTNAEKLGFKKGVLSAIVNTVTDPTVFVGYLMSRRFPMSAWLTGAIPQRFVGGATEFSGLSQITKPVESFFRGSHIPKLTALAMRREAEVMKVGERLMGRYMGRSNWRNEMETVSLLMEGQNPSAATPELKKLAGNMRSDMEELWGFLKQSKRLRGGLGNHEITTAYAEEWTPRNAPIHLRNYLPHIPLATNESMVEIDPESALMKMASGATRQALQLKGENPKGVWSPDSVGRLTSDFNRYQMFMNNVGAERVFTPRLFRRQRHNMPLQSATGDELFITDLNIIFPKYIKAVAKSYSLAAPLSEHERNIASILKENPLTGGWDTERPGSDPIMVQILNQGLKVAGGRREQIGVAGTGIVHERLVPNSYNAPAMSALRTLSRNLQGLHTEDQVWWGNVFSSIRQRVDRLRGQGATPRQLAEIDNAVSAIERTSNYREKANRTASFFYATTLGLNVRSALQNLFQPILTTAPSIGIGSTYKGYKALLNRMPVYAKNFGDEWKNLRGSKYQHVGRINEAVERAFKKSFPEMAEAGIKIDPRAFDVDLDSLRQAGISVDGRFRTRDDVYKFMLQGFSHTELSNKLVTFYGTKEALRKAIKTGEYSTPKGMSAKQVDDLLGFEAGMVVNATQFRPGPGGQTTWQAALPAPLRMFTVFPTRMFNYFAESTVRGAMTQKQYEQASFFEKMMTMGTGRNLSILAKTYVYGKLLNNGFKDVLGVDVSGALGLTSPFSSLPPDGQPFAPLPLPPVVGVVTGVLSAAVNRDWKELQPITLPGVGEFPIPKTLVPGGIAISKAIKAMSSFQPDMGGFVDDEERLMYRGNTTDMILAALGIPLDKQRRVQHAIDRLSSNRTAIRKYRRRFAVAALNADFEEMDHLQAKWRDAFPDMPPLNMSHKDIRAYDQSRRIPTVGRLLRTLGKDASYLEEDYYLEVDPELILPPHLDSVGGLFN